MVGVVGSSPIAPTNIPNEIKHLLEAVSAFFLRARKKHGKVVSVLLLLRHGFWAPQFLIVHEEKSILLLLLVTYWSIKNQPGGSLA